MSISKHQREHALLGMPPARMLAEKMYNAAPNGSPVIVNGTWVGTGVARFQELPAEFDLLIVKGEGQYSVMYSKEWWYGNVQAFGNTALSGSDGVPAPCLFQNGVQIAATLAAVNSNGVTYHWCGIKDNGSGIIKTIAYNGFRDKTVGAPDNQGAVSNPVTMTALSSTNPDIVYIKRDATGVGHEGVFATTTFVKKVSAVAVNNSLLTLSADGTMDLSTDISVNENDGGIVGEAHNVFALYNKGKYWDLLDYTGSASNISLHVAGDVAAVIVIPQAAQAMEFWLSTMGDKSADGGATALSTGKITAGAGFVSVAAGATVNTPGTAYKAIVFYKNGSSEQKIRPPARSGVMITTAGTGRVSCGADASLQITGAISMEWIGSIANTSSEQFIWGRGGSATTGSRATPVALSWNFGMSYTRDPDAGLEICTADRFSSEASNVSKQQRWRTGIVLRPSELYHIAVSHDGIDLWELYVNGVLVKWRRLPMSVFAIGGITGTAGLNMLFGARLASGVYAAAAVGQLHCFARVYNRRLTAAEWEKMYARHFLLTPNTDISDTATALVEEWKFGEGTGTTVAATKSSANNGTITGGAFVYRS